MLNEKQRAEVLLLERECELKIRLIQNVNLNMINKEIIEKEINHTLEVEKLKADYWQWETEKQNIFIEYREKVQEIVGPGFECNINYAVEGAGESEPIEDLLDQTETAEDDLETHTFGQEFKPLWDKDSIKWLCKNLIWKFIVFPFYLFSLIHDDVYRSVAYAKEYKSTTYES